MIDRKAWTPQSRMSSVDFGQSAANHAGRARVVDGVLTPGPDTAWITPEEYADQDFIIIPDFLTEPECDRLVTMFNRLHGLVKDRKIGIDFWEGRIVYMNDVAASDAAAAAIMGGFQKRACAMLGEFYDLTAPLWTDTVQLNIWEEGSFLPCHTDNSNPDDSPHSTPWRDFSSIVYLNDDYEGGELYFTAKDKVLKPTRGMLVAFSAGYHHEHGVLKVTSGRRITMPAFYTFDKLRAEPLVYPELAQRPAPLAVLMPDAQAPKWQPRGLFPTRL